jgi:hypothetical protein
MGMGTQCGVITDEVIHMLFPLIPSHILYCVETASVSTNLVAKE